jgi:hypothetical protein
MFEHRVEVFMQDAPQDFWDKTEHESKEQGFDRTDQKPC